MSDDNEQLVERIKYRSVTRKSVSKNLVSKKNIGNEHTRILMITPNYPSIDISKWVTENKSDIEHYLHQYGGVLFRGFDGGCKTNFKNVIQLTINNIQPYMEGATPRTELGDGIYTSTEFPSNVTISQHNELSYTNNWPMRISFACLCNANKGGETPLTDVRSVLLNIDKELRSEFAKKGWMLIRNYGNGLGPSWEKAFNTDDIDEVKRYCIDEKIDLKVFDNRKIRTKQIRKAIHSHPKTGEAVWFNHIAFWHPCSLDNSVREGLLAQFDEEDFPYSVTWGDESPISEDIIDHLNAAYQKVTLTSAWENGDIILLDNMLVAHGRRPFTGKRSVLVAMGQPYQQKIDS